MVTWVRKLAPISSWKTYRKPRKNTQKKQKTPTGAFFRLLQRITSLQLRLCRMAWFYKQNSSASLNKASLRALATSQMVVGFRRRSGNNSQVKKSLCLAKGREDTPFSTFLRRIPGGRL